MDMGSMSMTDPRTKPNPAQNATVSLYMGIYTELATK